MKYFIFSYGYTDHESKLRLNYTIIKGEDPSLMDTIIEKARYSGIQNIVPLMWQETTEAEYIKRQGPYA